MSEELLNENKLKLSFFDKLEGGAPKTSTAKKPAVKKIAAKKPDRKSTRLNSSHRR